MRMHEPLLYLPHMRYQGQVIDPQIRVKCPVCKTPFVIAQGVAFSATAEGTPTTGFFCTELCYLGAFPLDACGRA